MVLGFGFQLSAESPEGEHRMSSFNNRLGRSCTLVNLGCESDEAMWCIQEWKAQG